MDTDPGSRGIVIGDRYRVSGALRRTGLIDAVDLEADPADAACRVVAVPGDAERVDAWEDAWRAAQADARLPRLLEIVPDDDGAHWAVLAGSRAVDGPPAGAERAAAAIGAALAEHGLDVGDVTASMLAADADGRLVLDGVVWLGGASSPRAAGRAVAALLPPAEGIDDPPAPPAAPGRRPRARPRRLLLPIAIGGLVVAAATVVVAPGRSAGTTPVAPSAPAPPDVLLGAAGALPAVPIAAPESPVRPARRRTGRAEPPAPPTPESDPGPVAPEPPAPAAEPDPPLPEPAGVPLLPVADDPTDAPDLPLAEPVPALPVPEAG